MNLLLMKKDSAGESLDYALLNLNDISSLINISLLESLLDLHSEKQKKELGLRSNSMNSGIHGLQEEFKKACR